VRSGFRRSECIRLNHSASRGSDASGNVTRYRRSRTRTPLRPDDRRRQGCQAPRDRRFESCQPRHKKQRVGCASIRPPCIREISPGAIDAQVLSLFAEWRGSLGLAYLFVSHRIAEMYCGRIVETGKAATILRSASHPCTRALLATAPILVEDDAQPYLSLADGQSAEAISAAPAQGVTGALAMPSNCRLHPSCLPAIDRR